MRHKFTLQTMVASSFLYNNRSVPAHNACSGRLANWPTNQNCLALNWRILLHTCIHYAPTRSVIVTKAIHTFETVTSVGSTVPDSTITAAIIWNEVKKKMVKILHKCQDNILLQDNAIYTQAHFFSVMKANSIHGSFCQQSGSKLCTYNYTRIPRW